MYKDSLDMAASQGEKLLFGLKVSLIGMMIVFLLLILLAVCIMIISRVVRAVESASGKKAGKNAVAESAAPAVTAPSGSPLPDTQSAGSLDLVDVDEPTAAVIMAIVSDQSGIPLNRLLFKSIKKVD